MLKNKHHHKVENEYLAVCIRQGNLHAACAVLAESEQKLPNHILDTLRFVVLADTLSLEGPIFVEYCIEAFSRAVQVCDNKWKSPPALQHLFQAVAYLCNAPKCRFNLYAATLAAFTYPRSDVTIRDKETAYGYIMKHWEDGSFRKDYTVVIRCLSVCFAWNLQLEFLYLLNLNKYNLDTPYDKYLYFVNIINCFVILGRECASTILPGSFPIPALDKLPPYIDEVCPKYADLVQNATLQMEEVENGELEKHWVHYLIQTCGAPIKERLFPPNLAPFSVLCRPEKDRKAYEHRQSYGRYEAQCLSNVVQVLTQFTTPLRNNVVHDPHTLLLCMLHVQIDKDNQPRQLIQSFRHLGSQVKICFYPRRRVTLHNGQEKDLYGPLTGKHISDIIWQARVLTYFNAIMKHWSEVTSFPGLHWAIYQMPHGESQCFFQANILNSRSISLQWDVVQYMHEDRFYWSATRLLLAMLARYLLGIPLTTLATFFLNPETQEIYSVGETNGNISQVAPFSPTADSPLLLGKVYEMMLLHKERYAYMKQVIIMWTLPFDNALFQERKAKLLEGDQSDWIRLFKS